MGDGVDIRQHGCRARALDGGNRRHRGMGAGDHFLARDIEHAKAERDRVGARGDSHRVRAGAERRKSPLEGVDLRPQDVLATGHHAGYCRGHRLLVLLEPACGCGNRYRHGQ